MSNYYTRAELLACNTLFQLFFHKTEPMNSLKETGG